MKTNDIPSSIRQKVKNGVVIPAMPLALNPDRTFDEKHQRALTRYYIDAGVGGIAVGVHSTQFKIREPEINLFEPVLRLVSSTIDACCNPKAGILKVAGICGKTKQAIKEAEFAVENGYHAGLLSLAAFAHDDVHTMVGHCERVAEIMPIFGFYLQPSVGGRILPYGFWRKFAEIENVIAIKIAPFNRYQTFDVIRAVCDADRENDIALYTGNDDNIVIDLLTTYRIQTESGEKTVRIVGGLLGHWSVWTKSAVDLLAQIHELTENHSSIPPQMLSLRKRLQMPMQSFSMLPIIITDVFPVYTRCSEGRACFGGSGVWIKMKYCLRAKPNRSTESIDLTRISMTMPLSEITLKDG